MELPQLVENRSINYMIPNLRKVFNRIDVTMIISIMGYMCSSFICACARSDTTTLQAHLNALQG